MKTKKIEEIEKKYGKDFGTQDINKFIKYLKRIGYGCLARLLK